MPFTQQSRAPVRSSLPPFWKSPRVPLVQSRDGEDLADDNDQFKTDSGDHISHPWGEFLGTFDSPVNATELVRKLQTLQGTFERAVFDLGEYSAALIWSSPADPQQEYQGDDEELVRLFCCGSQTVEFKQTQSPPTKADPSPSTSAALRRSAAVRQMRVDAH
ncbi:hypothetical protein BP00DRAFT_450051 [Aspergillus indologenus CBS 114.80]|uniref:Uncharacterized protein n=1 Tax=Aspergillus indologenus CBS 114.80 TaxID=1450541 RepID=A0A2V5HY98_9EURO|nr:hypothetical protein BP00DRAFT_450051 [Aspergillus indologenus CBS 114.80]